MLAESTKVCNCIVNISMTSGLITWRCLYEKGKREWHYLIPTRSANEHLLQVTLCQRTLAFENAYFNLYRTYLLQLLIQANDDRVFALERLTQVVYIADEEMIKTIRTLNNSSVREVQQAAYRARECMQKVGTKA